MGNKVKYVTKKEAGKNSNLILQAGYVYEEQEDGNYVKTKDRLGNVNRDKIDTKQLKVSMESEENVLIILKE